MYVCEQSLIMVQWRAGTGAVPAVPLQEVSCGFLFWILGCTCPLCGARYWHSVWRPLSDAMCGTSIAYRVRFA
eukprot:802621-Rhodomonas_salina.1